MNDKLAFAGQWTLIAAEIIQPNGGIALDIRDQIQLITIYEDLFSPFISGNMVLTDTVDLPSLFLNSGTDMLRLKIKTPTIAKEETIDRFFHIYRLSDRQPVNERSQTYIYHFVAQESLLDSNIRLSKTYKGKPEENIGSIITSEMATSVPYNFDSTNAAITYTSNYWSPIKNFAYNADLAVASDDKSPAMVFYENRYGFNFKSLVKLINEKPKLEFSTDNSIVGIAEEGVSQGSTIIDINNDYKSIMVLNIPVHYDYIKDKDNGLLSNRMFSFDLTTKKLTDVTFNMNEDKRARPNPNVFYKPELINNSYKGGHSTIMLNHSKHTKLYDNTVDVSDFKFKQKRISLLRQMQQHKIEITVLGRTDYTVGKTTNILINTLRQFDKEIPANEIYDQMFTGKYLITAVAHRFHRDGKHECTLELSRDSIGEKK